jgi:radical SAM/SPASM domain protein of ACGX system
MYPYFAFQWHITDECDQRCKHCYIFSEGKQTALINMPYEKMEKVVKECIDFCFTLKRAPYFYITGGDPILHPDFWKLCELLKKNHIDFGILGNPFHLNDEVCQRLADYGCLKYQLSLDGLQQTHDRFRKPGSFIATLEKISSIRKAGMYCAVMTTVSSQNIDEIPDLIDIIVQHKVDVFAFSRYCPTSEEKSETYHVDPLRYRDFLETVWQKFELYKDSETTFNLKDHLWNLFFVRKRIISNSRWIEC